MELEITENIIRGSIVYALKNAFGNDYKYYDELIKQGFVKPSFHVNKIDVTSHKGYTGHQHKIVDNTYKYTIKYFTNEEYNKIKDINDKIDKLREIFSYLEIVNFKEGKVYTKPNRINDITITISDDVLLFDISFPVRTMQYLEIDKVKSNMLEQHIINKEKEER